MKKLRQWSVSKQVFFAFWFLCALLLARSGISYFGLQSVERSHMVQQSHFLNKLGLIDGDAQTAARIQAETLRQVLASDPGEIQRLDQKVREIEKINARQLAHYGELVASAKERQLYDRTMQARKVYWEQTEPVLAFGLANEDAAATKLIGSRQAAAYDEYLKIINELVKYVETETAEGDQTTSDSISQFRILSDIMGGLTLLVAVGIAFLVARISSRLAADDRRLRGEVAGRKLGEETLSESEEKFHQLADNITDVFWITSPDFKTTHFISAGYEKIWGRSKEGLYADPKQWVEAILPEDRDRVFAVFSSLRKDASRVSTDYRIARPDGTIRWVHDRGFQVRDAAGKVVRLTGIVTDITERKQNEVALHQQQTELRTLLDLVPAMIAFKDEDGVFRRVNQRFAENFGKSVEGMEGKATQLDDEEREVIHSGKPRLGRLTTVSNRNGADLWYQTDRLPVREKDGKVVGVVIMSQDITGRKRAEEHLQESEERFSAAFQYAPIGVALVSPEGHWLKVNAALCDLLGYSEAELLTRTFQDITYPEDLEADLTYVRRLLAGEIVSYHLEKRYIHPRGHLVSALLNVSLVRDGSGQPLYFISQLQDITERKRAEDELAYERDLLRTLLDNSPDHIYFKDTQSRIIKSSTAQARQFGLRSPDQLVGKTDFDFFTKEHAQPAFEEEQEIIRTGTPMIGRMEKEVWQDGRTESWVLTTKMPLRNNKGKIIGTFGISKDITAFKQIEKQLLNERARFQLIFDSIPVGVALCRHYPDGRNERIINDAHLEICGLTREQDQIPGIYGRITDPEDAARSAELYRQFESGEKDHISLEKRYLKLDGDISWVVFFLQRHSYPDGIFDHLTTVVDITSRKRLEIQLFQSQKMETVGKLAGGVAHEFNSILTTIIGQGELLLSQLPNGSPLSANALGIINAGGRAATLTRQLLAFSSKQMLRPEILDLNHVLTNMHGVFQHLMGTAVETRIIPFPGLRSIKVDAGQIEQVIMNMAINSRDAMPYGGKLTLETANVSLTPESVFHTPEIQPGNYVMLAITDTGFGMTPEVRARAFEPFFTTKGVGQGTGLGLATCYGTIKQSGGHISVYSEPGLGTTFKIYLPQIESQTKEPVQRPTSAGLPHGQETILLVEEDPALREMSCGLLARLGYSVIAASNGIDALGLQQEQTPDRIDLLLTDLLMPQINGQEIAQRIRVIYPEIKILFTFPYSEHLPVDPSVLDKGVALLHKPFTPSSLAQKVREILDLK